MTARTTVFTEAALLAVDLGVKTGLAWYGCDGRLVAYRSHNFGSTVRLRRGATAMLAALPLPAWLVLEGGGPLADIWEREAARLEIAVLIVMAETWRAALLLPREQRSGVLAKHHADAQARRVIAWSGAPRPTALRHDAAEAILVGLWAVIDLGWLDGVPTELRR